MRPADRSAYSYRHDDRVPKFDEGRILLVMDGDCALCSTAARRIAALDRRDEVRITTMQRPLGRALLEHYSLDADDPATWLMLRDGQARGSLDAMLALSAHLHPVFRPLGVLRLLPVRVQDWLYARIARNRYAMFGRDDLCAMPDPDLRRRLVE